MYKCMMLKTMCRTESSEFTTDTGYTLLHKY